MKLSEAGGPGVLGTIIQSTPVTSGKDGQCSSKRLRRVALKLKAGATFNAPKTRDKVTSKWPMVTITVDRGSPSKNDETGTDTPLDDALVKMDVDETDVKKEKGAVTEIKKNEKKIVETENGTGASLEKANVEQKESIPEATLDDDDFKGSKVMIADDKNVNEGADGDYFEGSQMATKSSTENDNNTVPVGPSTEKDNEVEEPAANISCPAVVASNANRAIFRKESTINYKQLVMLHSFKSPRLYKNYALLVLWAFLCGSFWCIVLFMGLDAFTFMGRKY